MDNNFIEKLRSLLDSRFHENEKYGRDAANEDLRLQLHFCFVEGTLNDHEFEITPGNVKKFLIDTYNHELGFAFFDECSEIYFLLKELNLIDELTSKELRSSFANKITKSYIPTRMPSDLDEYLTCIKKLEIEADKAMEERKEAKKRYDEYLKKKKSAKRKKAKK